MKNNCLRPLEKIEALPADQRQQLADWLDSGMTLDNVTERLKADFNVEIPRTTLHRFRKRLEVTDYLDTSPESARARAELINAAATGKPNFCQATIDLLEKQAFELAPATREDGVLDTLKALFALINGHRNTSVRERMAKVQEDKSRLREQELEWKKSTATTKSALSTQNSELKVDDLRPLALTPEDVERRAEAKFGNHGTQSHGVPSRTRDGMFSPLAPARGPGFAPANVSSGEQNTGGLGKSLGQGEGLPL